mgnify:CR=1 FL=1
MLVNEMSSLTSPLGHSSKYSENRSGNENRTNLANHSRTDLLCLRSKHIASYHSPAGPLQCTDTRISFITIFSVVVSLRAKLRKNRKYECHARDTGFHASQEPVTPSSKTSYFFPFFFYMPLGIRCYWNIMEYPLLLSVSALGLAFCGGDTSTGGTRGTSSR